MGSYFAYELRKLGERPTAVHIKLRLPGTDSETRWLLITGDTAQALHALLIEAEED
ncbi:hypothetical protein ABZ543_13320 [Streptomyces roseifaciens]